MNLDTLRTVAAGSGTYTVMYLGILPDLVSLGIGIATLVYLIVKIIRELNG